MTRLQEIEKLIYENINLINEYTIRAAELSESVRKLRKERKSLIKNHFGEEIASLFYYDSAVIKEDELNG